VTRPLSSLFRRVGNRSLIATLGARCRVAILAVAFAVLLALVLARLLNLFPTAAIAPVGAVALILAAVAVLTSIRRPAAPQVARAIDEGAGCKDLFLSALLAEEGGGFAAIVATQAAERAPAIEPAQIVPFRWQRGVRDVVLAAAVVAAAFAWLPQLDPLHRQVARERIAEQEKQLRELNQVTTLRKEELTLTKERETSEVQEALTRLEKTFQQAKPVEKESTLRALADRQKELGELWRKVNDPELRTQLAQTAQSFGQADPKRLEEWRKALEKGDATALKNELGELREAARQLAAQADSAEKRAAEQQLAQRLNELAQAMKQMTGSPQLHEALQRASTQLDLAKQDPLSKEAMEGAISSLELSEQEIEKLAQSLRDGKALEDALKNLQMARQLAEAGQLDGTAGEGIKGMEAYAALFGEKMSEAGAAAPLGREAPLGQGPGNGALRPEDELAKTGFKQEKSPSQIAGGKMLLEWKTKQVGETGARTEDYQAAMRSVQQGVAEAIQQEQVPPGYHEAIKRYFDSLPAK